MAKVADPLHSIEARGRVGGLIYNTTGGVKYVKAFTSPSQPGTARQLAVRGYFSDVAPDWKNLTQNQRDAWNLWATLHPVTDWTGVTRYMSGFNAYCALNSRLLDLGESVISDPPTADPPGTPSAFAAGNGVSQSILTWTSPGGTNLQAEVYMYGPHSA